VLVLVWATQGNERKLRTDLSAIALAKVESLNRGPQRKKERLNLDWPKAEQITVSIFPSLRELSVSNSPTRTQTNANTYLSGGAAVSK
jgi:hypothetical protein